MDGVSACVTDPAAAMLERVPSLAVAFERTRRLTEALAAPLSAEDQTVQSMPDTSPTKWHRAHTTWFFETFLLRPHLAGYEDFEPKFNYLFNSYYESVGARHPRPDRGMVTRPGIEAIASYRRHVDEAMAKLLADHGSGPSPLDELIELGINHEQQHQELLLMDIKHVLANNIYESAYVDRPHVAAEDPGSFSWVSFDGGVVDIGLEAGSDGFRFDNEEPRHQALVPSFGLADRLVTCGEWLEFIADGGYEKPELWLSDGWHCSNGQSWNAPLYWQQSDQGEWSIHTLDGRRPVDLNEPVCHVSFYEADAFATWAGARLPTEFEWEAAASKVMSSDEASGYCGALLDTSAGEQELPVDAAEGPVTGGRDHQTVSVPVADGNPLHPTSARASCAVDGKSGIGSLRQLIGDCWEWTGSPYRPYPGYNAPDGAIGEYNGKFMINTMVLRGGCAFTPRDHIRPTYRNFFHPHTRWHLSGLRLAADA